MSDLDIGSQEAPHPPRLLDQVRERLRLKHYSIRAEWQYVQWVKRFVLFHGKRHPAEMGGPEVEAFLTHLAWATYIRSIRAKPTGGRPRHPVVG